MLGPRVGDCGDDKSMPCNVTELAAHCITTPGCVGFNTNGFLKSCAGCEVSSDCCVFPEGQPYPGLTSTDLYIRAAAPPPEEWCDRVTGGSLLYAQPWQVPVCYMPEVGNGFLASTVSWASMHMAGLFNGHCGNVHKARFPSVTGINITNADAARTQMALDMERGVFLQRFYLDTGAVIEQRVYAHRLRRHLMVVELSFVAGDGPVLLNLSTLFDPSCGEPVSSLPKAHQSTAVPCNNQGNGCAGGLTTDFVIQQLASPVAQPDTEMFNLTTTEPDDGGLLHNAVILMDKVPATIDLEPNATRYFLSAIAADIEPGLTPQSMVIAEYNSARENPALLLQEHADAWQSLWDARIEVERANQSASLMPGRALQVSHALMHPDQALEKIRHCPCRAADAVSLGVSLTPPQPPILPSMRVPQLLFFVRDGVCAAGGSARQLESVFSHVVHSRRLVRGWTFTGRAGVGKLSGCAAVPELCIAAPLIIMYLHG